MSRFPEAAARVRRKAHPTVLGALFAVMTATAGAEPLGLGREATPEEIAAWDIDIRPDGQGLPEGSGTVAEGEPLYTERCSTCHGVFGEGAGRWPVLAGGQGTLASVRPVKTIGSYWPYLSTVWDYVHRAMPFGAAQSLTDDEVYAITAYLLYLNDIVDDDFELSSANFGEIELPNEGGFFMDNREETAVWQNEDACMENCKDDVKITMRARVLDVTPDAGGASMDEGGTMDEGHSENGGTQMAAAEDGTGGDAGTSGGESGDGDTGGIDVDLAAEGEKVFRKCKACHMVGPDSKNRVGPMLNGIVGAPVGAVDGFKYSKALQAKHDEGAVWTAETLHAFLEDPKGWAKGTKMSFRGLDDEADRNAVIEYLKAASE